MTDINKKEIKDRKDVTSLVNKFYTRVQKDELIGPIFKEVIGNHWSSHMEKMYDFWESRLFDKDTYSGKPLMRHLPLPIGKPHFDRWLKLWNETIDDYFVGEIAEKARLRAETIGRFFQEKLEERNK